MNKQSLYSKDMVANDKNNVISCSTPEHRAESPSRDSDSLCDSDAGSPVPFLCTQDGAEGETDVVWNFYTPKSERSANTNLKNTTPISRKSKRSLRPKLIEKQLPKRRAIRSTQKRTELYQELLELNQNLHELIPKKQQNIGKQHSGSEDDIFNDSPEYSPKSARRLSSNCLRRNVLSSNFGKPDTDTALESDDSMNECLLKASQVVEEILDSKPTSPKRICYGNNISKRKTDIKFKLDNDSMDAILSNVRLESPVISKTKKCDSPRLKDDSFDSLVGNLNDSMLEQLSQMPVKNTSYKNTDWKVKELVVHDGSPVSRSFGRHNSMPESPSITDINKPSTSGMAFGRYSSMPFENESGKTLVPDDSPIRCTPDEIKKKHKQAREKLLAKRLLPFTSSQASQPIIQTQIAEIKNTKFQPRVPSSLTNLKNNITTKEVKFEVKSSNNATDLKLLLEKKRQEALLKLRRRQPQSKMS